MTFQESYDRVQLLIAAMTKARELGDALLEAEEAGLALDVAIEIEGELNGRPVRRIVVTPTPRPKAVN